MYLIYTPLLTIGRSRKPHEKSRQQYLNLLSWKSKDPLNLNRTWRRSHSARSMSHLPSLEHQLCSHRREVICKFLVSYSWFVFYPALLSVSLKNLMGKKNSERLIPPYVNSPVTAFVKFAFFKPILQHSARSYLFSISFGIVNIAFPPLTEKHRLSVPTSNKPLS